MQKAILNEELFKQLFPEYKMITHFNYESDSVFKFVYNNSIDSGKDFLDILYFSIYNYVLTNQNNLTHHVFFEVFKNLKKLVILNRKKYYYSDKSSDSNKKDKLPIFYYQTIYKSICFFNKYIIDWNEFYYENNVQKLEEILEFLPDLFSRLHHDYQIEDDGEIKKCIDQIEVFYEHLMKTNERYNRVNKQMVSFFLKNLSPCGECNSTKSENTGDMGCSTDSQSENFSKIAIMDDVNFYHEENRVDSTILGVINVINEKVKDPTRHKNNVKTVIHEQDFTNPKLFNSKSDEYDSSNHNKYSSRPDILPTLTSKVKKYSDHHYTREKFREKFILPNKINENVLYLRLEQVATTLFQAVNNYSNKTKQNLDLNKLQKEFTQSFSHLSIELIGSLSLDLYSNLPGRTTIDLVILAKNPLEEILVKVKNMNGMIKIINEYNDEFHNYNKNHKITIQDRSEDSLEYFYCDALLYSKSSHETFNIKLFMFKEDLKFTNDFLEKLFKIQNLKILHIFFQEILISKIGAGKIFCYRSDISILLLSFLDYHYNILNKHNKIQVTFKNLDYDREQNYDSDIKLNKFCISNETNYYYDLNTENLKKMSSIPLGELIVEFFRWIINLLHYIKFLYYKTSMAKGFEILKRSFDRGDIRDNYYIFNLCFIFELLEMNQDEFNKEILKRISEIEKVFFKICESYDMIINYEQITFYINIEEGDSEKILP